MSATCIKCYKVKSLDEYSATSNKKKLFATCDECRSMYCGKCKQTKTKDQFSYAIDGWSHRICNECVGVKPDEKGEKNEVIKFLRCDACDYSTHDAQCMTLHQRSKIHAINSGTEVIVTNYVEQPYTCETCKFGCRIANSLYQHNKGKMHLLRVSKLAIA